MFKTDKDKLKKEIQKSRQIPLLLSGKEKIYLRPSPQGWFIYREAGSNIQFFYPDAANNTIWNKIDRYMDKDARSAVLAFSTCLRNIESDPEKSDFIDEHEEEYQALLAWLNEK